MSQPDRYLVLGNPIAHSKSPLIHAMFAEQTGQHLTYDALLVELDEFEKTLKRLQAEGVKGANVTVPFKQEAWQAMSLLSERAKYAKAVNTIVFTHNGELFGDNTDGVGLVTDFQQNNGVSLKDKHILLLGAGGASRGVIAPFLAEAPAQIVVANRTVARAHELVADFAELHQGKLSGCGFDELDTQQFDVVVNATAASLSGELPPIPQSAFAENACAYDMMYGTEPTVFLQWAQQAGVSVVLDGLGMLIEQAAEAFHVWRGVRPETQQVITALRSG